MRKVPFWLIKLSTLNIIIYTKLIKSIVIIINYKSDITRKHQFPEFVETDATFQGGQGGFCALQQVGNLEYTKYLLKSPLSVLKYLLAEA
jgi:hypothetical protein